MPPGVKLSTQHLIKTMCRHLHDANGSKGLRSTRSRNNIHKALECIRGRELARGVAVRAWKQCLDISPQVFVLFSASFGADTIVRQGQDATGRLISQLRARHDIFDRHPTLCSLVQEYRVAERSGLSPTFAVTDC